MITGGVKFLTVAALTVLAGAGAAAVDDPEQLRLMSENAELRRRIAVLESETADLRERLTRNDASLRQLRTWLAQLAVDGKMLSPERREERLGLMLVAVIRSGLELTMSCDAVLAEVRELGGALASDPVRRAQLDLRLEALERAVRRFNAATVAAEVPRLSRCRILKIDRDLGVVILSVGSAQGAFSGMIYTANGVELKLIGVRPHASAATVTRGDPGRLAPGMEAVTGTGTGQLPRLMLFPELRNPAPRR